MSADQLKQLFTAYFDRTATSAEKERLLELLNRSEYDFRVKALLEEAWTQVSRDGQLFSNEESSAILSNIIGSDSAKESSDTEIPRRKHLFGLRLAAASVLLAVLVSAVIYSYLTGNSVSENSIVTKNSIQHDVKPGMNTALLTLADGSVIILDSTSNGAITRQGHTRVIKMNGAVSYNKEDSVLVAKQPREITYNTITTPRKGTYKVILSDNTAVWLNAASSIRFPTSFTGSKRVVEITGEVYFEVESNPAMPFLVKVASTQSGVRPMEIEVLGTHFNVNAYPDEKYIRTTLLEGLVKVRTNDKNQLMKPGQQLRLDSAGNLNLISSVATDKVVAWKNGIFDFDEDSLDEILRQLARWYDVEIASPVPERYYTGAIRREVNISEVLKMLESASKKVSFSIANNQIKIETK
ncbi:MAG TPA: FecR domain-containing protein [Parasegetibacter sp.]|jgi:transmembrane sensor